MASTTERQTIKPVAIIGAGLGGLALALALKKRGIDTEFFELRNLDYDFGGAIMLSPNALRVLDSIDAYERVRGKGYSFETLEFKHDQDFDRIGTYYFGHEERYGYRALRIYRKVLLHELRQMVQEKGIPIHYGEKFSHVVSEDETGVTFAFADGKIVKAPLLIGADGIHSKVRQYIDPSVVPVYAGFIGVTFAFPASKLRFPQGKDVPVPVSLHGPNGAFVLAPQNRDGTEMFAGRQFKCPLQGREGWDMLLKEKTELVGMHQADMEAWSDLVRSAQEQAGAPDAHSMAIWPFHRVPELARWSSDTGRVVIMGDAAHAIPPTAGQGANQAFEDSLSLAVLLKMWTDGEVGLKSGLDKWRAYRQTRIDKVLELSDQMNNMRLSEEEKRKLPKEKVWSDHDEETEGGQLGWLYTVDIEEDVKALAE